MKKEKMYLKNTNLTFIFLFDKLYEKNEQMYVTINLM